MARVKIAVPDDLPADARAAGPNASPLVASALAEELDRRGKRAELDAHLAQSDAELGPVPPDEEAAAREWADGFFADGSTRIA